ncbi:MAG: ABC transporter ATP-binding protein [Caldilineaceae bacterium]|nr:ABC transporter ATP-binding protein [Caldilineaceae bacterium]
MGTDGSSQPESPLTDGTEPDRRPLLQIQELHTQFETKQGTVRAVDGLSLDLYEGEVLGLVGESGCGKTMTALSIMGLLPGNGQAVAGEIKFEGKNLLVCSSEEMKKIRGGQIAMIFQEPMTALTPTMTIGRQISEAMEIHLDLSRQEAAERALELLEHVGIPSPRARFDNYIHQFSGGMRQRVMIAIAFSCEPRLLLADEPTTALDVTVQAQILDLIKQLAQEAGMTALFITHDMGIVAGSCDRVAVMYAGRMVEIGPVDDVLLNPRHPYTQGLLGSVPSLDSKPGDRLFSISGLPPDLASLPTGCKFWPRCPLADDRCREEEPVLEQYGESQAACWKVMPLRVE